MTPTHKMLAPLFLALLIWQIVSAIAGIPPFILPSPDRVFLALWNERSLLTLHASITVAEIFAGFLLGVIFGCISAVALARSSLLRIFLKPILIFSQNIPIFVLAPLLTLWFGYGVWPKVIVTIMAVYFPITLSFFDALMRTPREWLELARIMGASRTRTLLKIRIPNALPGLASGLRLAAVYAPIGAILGEWVGASKGLGYLMLLANGRAKTELMFAALFVLAMLTLFFQMFIDKACRSLFDSAR